MDKSTSALFSDVKQRAKKAGHPPGTFIYTGRKKEKKPEIISTHFDTENCQVITSHDIQQCLPEQNFR